jgi:putative ABC transport system ATP-binding protein
MTKKSEQPALLLQAVKFAYASGCEPVIDIPFWKVSKGERIFLRGASGSGKSTLLNLLSGMLVATEGDVSISGTVLNRLNARQRDRFRAQHIGVVFQQFNLIPYLSVMDNVLLAASFAGGLSQKTREKAGHLFAQVNLPASLYQQKAMSLSIGQQQRVAIVRALLNSPDILLVDEPTSALDADNRDAFMALLLKVVAEQEASLVFVSHDLSLAHYFENTIELNDMNIARANLTADQNLEAAG